MSILDIIREDARAADAALYTGDFGVDNRYWQDLGYAFILHGPKPGQEEAFHLVLAPTRYDKRLPAAAEITPSQNGGVVAEENGFIVGDLVIEGHTGVSPRAVDDVPIPLSGQAHFKRLQDDCYLRYLELKANPLLTENVFLTFHSFKDDEHFIVVPLEMGLTRDAAGKGRTHYPYRFNLKIVGNAQKLVIKGPEDNPVIAALKDAYAAIGGAVGELNGFITDAGGGPLLAETAAAFQGVQAAGEAAETAVSIVREVNGGVQRVAGAASEFLRGVSHVIKLPYEAMQAIIDDLDAMLGVLRQAEALPTEVVQSYRRVVDSMEAIAAYPEVFKESFSDAADDFLAAVKGPSSASAASIDTAENASVTSSAQLTDTALTPGDPERIRAGVFDTGRTFQRYQGFRPYVVQADDLLPLIAEREMSDARLWVDLALANELSSPYISDSGLPNTVAPGDTILIPTLTSSEDNDNVKSAGDPVLGASQYEELLGRDWTLEQVPGSDQWTWKIDDATGARDFETVAGIANVEQAIHTILRTEKGECPMRAQLGYQRLLGKAGTMDRLFEAQLRITQALLRDPRLLSVKVERFSFALDKFAVSLQAILKGAIQLRTMARSIS